MNSDIDCPGMSAAADGEPMATDPHEQRFCLRWNQFHSNMASVVAELRDSELFADVTLACRGQMVRAHKVVLSACSPFFKSVLLANPCHHPVIVMPDGVSYSDLRHAVDFAYRGQLDLAHSQLRGLLQTASQLQIKGLCDLESACDTPFSAPPSSAPSPPPTSPRPQQTPSTVSDSCSRRKQILFSATPRKHDVHSCGDDSPSDCASVDPYVTHQSSSTINNNNNNNNNNNTSPTTSQLIKSPPRPSGDQWWRLMESRLCAGRATNTDSPCCSPAVSGASPPPPPFPLSLFSAAALQHTKYSADDSSMMATDYQQDSEPLNLAAAPSFSSCDSHPECCPAASSRAGSMIKTEPITAGVRSPPFGLVAPPITASLVAARPNATTDVPPGVQHQEHRARSQHTVEGGDRKLWSEDSMETALECLRTHKLTLSKASVEFGIPSTTLWQRAHKIGIETPKKEGCNKNWTDNDLQMALNDLRNGKMSANKASKWYGIPNSTLYKIAKKEGIKLSAPFSNAQTTWRADDLQQALTAIRCGQSVMKAGARFGIPAGTLYGRCRRAGIELKPATSGGGGGAGSSGGQPWSEADMQHALHALQRGGLSINRAAQRFNLPYSSLYGRRKRSWPAAPANVSSVVSTASSTTVVASDEPPTSLPAQQQSQQDHQPELEQQQLQMSQSSLEGATTAAVDQHASEHTDNRPASTDTADDVRPSSPADPSTSPDTT